MENLIKKYNIHHKEILAWVQKKFVCKSIDLPLFSSIDIRNSGYKTAHVDLNLFPSGFNNIDEEAKRLSIELCKEYFRAYYDGVSKILIYPEQFSRNLMYLESLTTLYDIIKSAGYDVGIILNDEIFDEVNIGGKVHLSDLHNDSSEVSADLIVLNNDLTDGVPDFLARYDGSIIPTPKLGWHSRRKSEHFIRFNHIVEEVAKQFEFDPWLISNYNDICANVDFRERKNLESIACAIDSMIEKVGVKYKEYGIEHEPYVFIKSDQGTFGLGIMTARSGEEILKINKKRRHSMQKIKLGVENNQVLIQEGVPTISKTQDGHTAEEMVYSVFARPTCIFNRINAKADEFSNLNSHGMMFDHCQALPSSDIRYLINELANIATIYEEY